MGIGHVEHVFWASDSRAFQRVKIMSLIEYIPAEIQHKFDIGELLADYLS